MPKVGDVIQGNKIEGYNDYGKCIWSVCCVCGKERWVKLGKDGEPIHKRCNSCSKKGKNNPRWNGGKNEHRQYIEIWDSKKKCNVKEHRLVMEEFLGRKLTNKEVIHHINKDIKDNRIENLILFENDSQHKIFHHKNGDYKESYRKRVERHYSK